MSGGGSGARGGRRAEPGAGGGGGRSGLGRGGVGGAGPGAGGAVASCGRGLARRFRPPRRGVPAPASAGWALGCPAVASGTQVPGAPGTERVTFVHGPRAEEKGGIGQGCGVRLRTKGVLDGEGKAQQTPVQSGGPATPRPPITGSSFLLFLEMLLHWDSEIGDLMQLFFFFF